MTKGEDMTYKRYGYKFTKLNGSENLLVLLAFPLAFFASLGLDSCLDIPYIMWSFVPFSLLFLYLIEGAVSKVQHKTRERKKQKCIERAFRLFDAGDLIKARANIRLARTYGDLPSSIIALERQIHLQLGE